MHAQQQDRSLACGSEENMTRPRGGISCYLPVHKVSRFFFCFAAKLALLLQTCLCSEAASGWSLDDVDFVTRPAGRCRRERTVVLLLLHHIIIRLPFERPGFNLTPTDHRVGQGDAMSKMAWTLP
jgi:hypothetical protein